MERDGGRVDDSSLKGEREREREQEEMPLNMDGVQVNYT